MFDVDQGFDAPTPVLSNCLDFQVKLIFDVDQGSDAPTHVLSNYLDFHVKLIFDVDQGSDANRKHTTFSSCLICYDIQGEKTLFCTMKETLANQGR